MSEKVAVGLSGGVDSAAALFFLKQQGYQCVGVHFRLADLPEEEAEQQRKEAEKAAKNQEVPFYTADLRALFGRYVTDYFSREYLDGRTPNPCIVCNEKVRWNGLMEFGKQMGIRLVATGHYAKIVEQGGRYALAVPEDRKKDQTYFLYRLSQEQLSRTRFPLGNYKKQDVRMIAEKLGIQAAKKPDSQEICFLPDGDRSKWFCNNKEVKKGEILDDAGNVLGHHRGICYYTVGQRKGLGISGPEPLYVRAICKEENRLLVSGREQIYSMEANVYHTVWMAPEQEKLKGAARIRSGGPLIPCTAYREEEGYWKVLFWEPVWAVAPGQSMVFYQNNTVVFGGIIENARVSSD